MDCFCIDNREYSIVTCILSCSDVVTCLTVYYTIINYRRTQCLGLGLGSRVSSLCYVWDPVAVARSLRKVMMAVIVCSNVFV